MFNYAPEQYNCPFCRLGRGEATSSSNQDDIIYRDDQVTAFMASKWWPNNKGHVLVVPNTHYENVYDGPPGLGAPLQRVIRDVAVAMKGAYGCAGISTRQHNEPHGGQDVWHYHVHVYPRYKDDFLYLTAGTSSTPEARTPYVEELRRGLGMAPD